MSDFLRLNKQEEIEISVKELFDSRDKRWHQREIKELANSRL